MPDKRSISTKWPPWQGMKKAPVVCRDIRQATGGLWESRERRRVRVTFMAKWVRLHPSEPLLWGNALHPFDFQLFRFLSCYFLFITQKRHTFVWRFCCASFSSTHFGGGGESRTPVRKPFHGNFSGRRRLLRESRSPCSRHSGQAVTPRGLVSFMIHGRRKALPAHVHH